MHLCSHYRRHRSLSCAMYLGSTVAFLSYTNVWVTLILPLFMLLQNLTYSSIHICHIIVHAIMQVILLLYSQNMYVFCGILVGLQGWIRLLNRRISFQIFNAVLFAAIMINLKQNLRELFCKERDKLNLICTSLTSLCKCSLVLSPDVFLMIAQIKWSHL